MVRVRDELRRLRSEGRFVTVGKKQGYASTSVNESPRNFYRKAVARKDVRGIMERLAKR